MNKRLRNIIIGPIVFVAMIFLLNGIFDYGYNVEVTPDTLSINQGDIWGGYIHISNGTFNFDYLTDNDKFVMEKGTLNINSGKLSVSADSLKEVEKSSKLTPIYDAVDVTLADNATLSLYGYLNGDEYVNNTFLYANKYPAAVLATKRK